MSRFDQEHIWHPYTSLTEPLHCYDVERAEKSTIHLRTGEKLIDGMSSWWACIHGYNNPELNEAIEKQLKKMAHIMFGGIRHEPSELLAQKLLGICPSHLHNVFFSDSGSVSVEVAMKMAVQYQYARNKTKRTKFLTSRFGYHGDTSAAMSVCDPINGMHSIFKNFIPDHYFGPPFPMGFDSELDLDIINEYRELIESNADEIAAFIIEPVVQGAGGMRIYNPKYLNVIQEICQEHDILFIADEIATGFGRTGKLFACEHSNLAPDILCLGKALSGGYITFAATLSTKKIAHCISNSEPKTFMHGPTFMANPLACSVSLRSIQLILERDYLSRIKEIEDILKSKISRVPNCIDIRILGAIAILEFEDPINVSAAQKYFVEKGVWIRPFRNLVYIMPPFIITNSELEKLIEVIIGFPSHKGVFLQNHILKVED